MEILCYYNLIKSNKQSYEHSQYILLNGAYLILSIIDFSIKILWLIDLFNFHSVFKDHICHSLQCSLIMPSSNLIFSCCSLGSGLVMISAICSLVFTCLKIIFLFSTLSLRKWCLMWMCFTREWCTGSLDMHMALVLSQ